MIGSIVNHPLFGRGQVVELRNAAREAAVSFDNGIRAVVPANILAILQSSNAPVPPPRPITPPPADTVRTPEQQQRLAARRTVEALRYPDGSDAGTLVPLFDRILDNPTIYGSLMEKLSGTIFASALHNYSLLRAKPGEELNLFLDWISGEKVFITAVRNALPVKSKE